MIEMAKTLIMIGSLCLIIGVALLVFPRIPGLGKLPGDILLKKNNMTFYFPVMTCLVISLILSFIFFLWQQK